MAKIERYTVRQDAWVYPESGLPPVETTRNVAELQEATAIAAAGINDDDDDDFGSQVMAAIEIMLGAWPACEPMDTTILYDGRAIPSFRQRLYDDIVKAVSWQVGHADESFDQARDELLAAYRESDRTEIAIERIEMAETRVQQAEARIRLWRDIADAARDGWRYPAPATTSVDGMNSQLTYAFDCIADLCGNRTHTFVAHRLAWAIARLTERAMKNAGDRHRRATGKRARELIAAQDRAARMLHAAAVIAYERGTGEVYASNTIAGATVLADAHQRIAEWLDARRRKGETSTEHKVRLRDRALAIAS